MDKETLQLLFNKLVNKIVKNKKKNKNLSVLDYANEIYNIVEYIKLTY